MSSGLVDEALTLNNMAVTAAARNLLGSAKSGPTKQQEIFDICPKTIFFIKFTVFYPFR